MRDLSPTRMAKVKRETKDKSWLECGEIKTHTLLVE